MRIQLTHTFSEIVGLDNLLLAWQEFLKGKRNKPDVQLFERNLIDNLVDLYTDLVRGRYRHGGYQAFCIADPKPRHIHKASVRDRVLHHAIHRVLDPFFESVLLYDSYSCQRGKGTHKALERFRRFAQVASGDHARTCWVLKCDIKKFFASIDHHIMLGILATYIRDVDVLWLLQEIVGSFYSKQPGKGLSLGNLTSQLLVNVYMHEFDYYVKHNLKAKHYIRYADDFILLSADKTWLAAQIPKIATFLHGVLALHLHPGKISIRSLASGVDFLGWVHFPDHRVLRPATARRMRKRISKNPTPETLQSYLGLMSHGNTQRLTKTVISEYWLWKNASS